MSLHFSGNINIYDQVIKSYFRGIELLMASTHYSLNSFPKQPDQASSQLSQDDVSSNSTSHNNKDSMTKESCCHEKTTSTPCKSPRIVLKFSSESKKETDDNVTSSKTLIPKNVDESTKGKTWDEKNTTDCHDTQLGLGLVPPPNEKAQKKKIIFPNKFSVSLTRDQIEADLLAMSICGSNSTKRNKRSKKRPMSVRRQEHHLFPDMRLKFITPYDYRVPDST